MCGSVDLLKKAPKRKKTKRAWQKKQRARLSAKKGDGNSSKVLTKIRHLGKNCVQKPSCSKKIFKKHLEKKNREQPEGTEIKAPARKKRAQPTKIK